MLFTLIYLAPSLPPLSLVVMVTSSKSVIMSWDSPPPESRNGIIREYLVVLHDVLLGTDLSFTAFSNVLNISSLNPFTEYRVKVAAVTVEAGPFTLEHNITTFEDGNLVYNVSNYYFFHKSQQALQNYSVLPLLILHSYFFNGLLPVLKELMA